jgi:hypothetical protein
MLGCLQRLKFLMFAWFGIELGPALDVWCDFESCHACSRSRSTCFPYSSAFLFCVSHPYRALIRRGYFDFAELPAQVCCQTALFSVCCGWHWPSRASHLLCYLRYSKLLISQRHARVTNQDLPDYAAKILDMARRCEAKLYLDATSLVRVD